MFKVGLKPAKGNDSVLGLVGEWVDRALALRSMLTYSFATEGLSYVLSKIPVQHDYADYRKSLEVVDVRGGPNNQSKFAIRSNPKYRKVRSIDVPHTALYIRPRRYLRKIRPEIKILEKYSPWTPETLPFTPKQSEALVIYRKVQLREAEQIAKARKRDKPKWSEALSKLGFRISNEDSSKIDKDIKVMPDLAFQAMRLEFGVGGQKAVPHWRPMSKFLMGDGGNKILKSPMVGSALADPNFKAWKDWSKPKSKQMAERDSKDLEVFQKKLFKG